MYFAYILYSPSKDQYYKGHTGLTPLQRLERHNLQHSASTKSGVPWNLVFYKSFETKSEAIKYERFLKRQRNRSFIESLIASGDNELK